jgi:hypothetical protein
MWDTIKGYLVEMVDFFIYLITILPLKAMEAIPVPEFLGNTSFALPPGVMWFASAFELATGLGIMTAAWGARFLVRRLPVIG